MFALDKINLLWFSIENRIFEKNYFFRLYDISGAELGGTGTGTDIRTNLTTIKIIKKKYLSFNLKKIINTKYMQFHM